MGVPQLLRAAAVAVVIATVHGQALPACGQGCYDDLKAKFGSLGCEAATEACLCTKPNFLFGIHDCAIQACGADVANQVTAYANSICATVTGVPTPTQPATTASARSTATAAGQAGTGSATSSPVAAQNSGLSTAAKAGIGVAAAVGAVAIIAGIFVFFFLRGRKKKQTHRTLQISDPLPGSGRSYADDHDRYPPEKTATELEMKSRRYEEMVPRQKPQRVF